MILTKQTTIVFNYVDPDYPGDTGIDPYPISQQDLAEFEELITSLMAQNKTDGVQYSSQIGTSIRKWADAQTAQLYFDFVVPNLILDYGVPENGYTTTVQDIPDTFVNDQTPT